MPIKNDVFWKMVFKEKFIPQIDIIKNSLKDRILPTFNDIEQEAGRLEGKEFDRLSVELSGNENVDMADLADMARDESIGYYHLMNEMKTETLHIFYILLYKVFDQQFSYFYRKEILTPMEERDPKLKEWRVVYDRFKRVGIMLMSMETYRKINILRLISNVIKHGEGSAAEELRKIASSYFNHADHMFYSVFISDDIRDDLKLSLADFESHAENIRSFWMSFSNE